MVNPNFQCVVVSYGRVSGKAKQYKYWEPAIYESYITKNGDLVWKLKCLTNRKARRSYNLAQQDAKDCAVFYHIPFIDDRIRQYYPIKTKLVLDY